MVAAAAGGSGSSLGEGTVFLPNPVADLQDQSLTDPACVADWDSVSYTSTVPHCLRRVDTNLHYPGDLNGEVHHDGQIWSRALWDIRKALGNVAADTTIIEAHFDMPNPTMPQLAATTVAVAKQLYGNGAATKVKAAFVARGILQ